MAPGRPMDQTDALSSSIAGSDVDTSDWPAQAANTIERVVQGVRDKTTGPAIEAARWLVAGFFLVLAGTMVAILLAIALVRMLDAYLPDSWVGEEHMWLAHGIVGSIFAGVGLFFLGRRHSPSGRS